MLGLNILYIQPRLIGSVKNWSGFDSPDKKSWLIEHAKSMGFNALWFSPMARTSDYEFERNGKKLSGSLYATKDHFRLDRDFNAASGQPAQDKIDRTHMRHFTKQATQQGMHVLGDLVFNHVAVDHHLVLQENKAIEDIKQTGKNIRPLYRKGVLSGVAYEDQSDTPQEFYFKFARNEGAYDLQIDGTEEELWDDVAKINYNSPAALDHFVHGENGRKGYWKQVIDWHLDMGFTGFRCDVAYKVPAAVWSELVQYAHDRKPGVIFMAETLGDNGQASQLKEAKITVDGKSRKAFDLAMLPNYWWDMKDNWMIAEHDRLHKLSRFGGAGSPDNHDTPQTIAGHFLDALQNMDKTNRERTVAAICLREYAIAALISNSVYMQLGYEYCRKQVSVFRNGASYKDWQALEKDRGAPGHPLNLVDRIKAINDFKESLKARNAIVRLERTSNENNLIRLECALVDKTTGNKKGRLVIFANEKPENGPLSIKRSELEDKDHKRNMDRLVLGPKDSQEAHICEINDIAAYYTPEDTAHKPPLTPGVNNENHGPGPAP